MTEFREEDQIAEVMHRTMYNLQYIDERRGSDGPYEVTQLINSFMGAAVLPWERLLRKHRETVNLAEQQIGWPKLTKDRPTDNQPVDLYQQLQWIRHAFAHGNISFKSTGGEISAIRLRNDGFNGIRWGVELDVEQLKTILRCYGVLANQLGKSDWRQTSDYSGEPRNRRQRTPPKHIRKQPPLEQTSTGG